jgi:AcrR family transcriptional regulator
MKIKARREREKVEFRQSILDAARSLAAEQGWENVSIRKIADRIEYSPPMIYEYFTDKEALLRTLLDLGFQHLNARIHAVLAAEPDPQRALITMAAAYWDYAFENPEMFKVMNGLDGAVTGPFTLEDKPIEMLKGMQLVSETIQRWADSQQLKPADLESAFLHYWSAINGLVLLVMTGRVHIDDQAGRALIQQQAEVLLAGWAVLWQAPRYS